MTAAAAAVAAAVAVLLLAPVLDAKDSSSSKQRTSSRPFMMLDHHQQQPQHHSSDEDTGLGAADDVDLGGAAATYSVGHTVLSKPPAPSDHGGAGGVSNCSMCESHEQIRRFSKRMIQDEILQKLGLQRAPNITGRPKPKIPPIGSLFERFSMQGDQPYFQPGETFYEEDDMHAKTTMVIVVAQSSKFSQFFYIFIWKFKVYFYILYP
jgi:hypothetical protein